jgi:hypothetical protein
MRRYEQKEKRNVSSHEPGPDPELNGCLLHTDFSRIKKGMQVQTICHGSWYT